LPASANWPAEEASAGGAVAVPDDEGVILEGVDGEEEEGVTGVAGVDVAVPQPGINRLIMKTTANNAITLYRSIVLHFPSVFTGSGE
jgi:hypothetical protein